MTPTRLAISFCLLAGLFSHAQAIEFEQTGRYVAPPQRLFLNAPVGVGGGYAVVGQLSDPVRMFGPNRQHSQIEITYRLSNIRH